MSDQPMSIGQLLAERAANAPEKLSPEERERRRKAEEEARERGHQRWLAEQEEKAQREAERKIAFIPPRYRQAEVDVPIIKAWIGDFVTTDYPDSLLLTGPTGTGKTHQLWAVARWMANADISVAYHAVPMLMLRLRPGGDDPVELITSLGQVDVLLLDDLGAEKRSEYVETSLHQILDVRYQWKRPSLFATNVAPSELAQAVGERLSSRLAEMCVTVPVTGVDRRRA